MKKLNRIALSLSSVAAVAAPAIATISCGDDEAGRYNTDNDHKLQILNAFSSTGKQHKALEILVREWNKTAATRGKYPVELVNAVGGYPKIASNLETSFNAHDTKKIPNMIIAYPDALGTIGKYDMTTPLTNDAKIKALFNDEFTSINDQIGGVKPGGMYALPFAKSIDMMTINIPVMAHIFKLAVDNGILTDSSSVLATSKYAAALTASAEKTLINETWGTALKNKPSTVSPKGDIKDVLNTTDKMLDFIAYIRPMLDTRDDNHQWILGIDSATNFIYQSVAQIVGNDIANKFLFSKGADGYVNYKWGDRNSAAWKAFDKVYTKLAAAIRAKAVYLNTGGAYSSNHEVLHKIGMAIGSTAGYSHNFIRSGKVPVVTVNGKETPFNGDEFEKNDDFATQDFFGKFGHYHNKLAKSTSTTASKYDTKLASADIDSKVAAFLGSHAAAVANKGFFISSADEAASIPDADKVLVKAPKDPNKDKAKYLVFTSYKEAGSVSLQETELEIQNSPWKFSGASADNNANVQLVQGPSLIGVHTSAAEDAQLADFVEWLMKQDITNVKKGWKDAPDVTQTGKAYEIFAQNAGYIVPTKAAFDSEPSWVSHDPALQLTYKTLSGIQKYNTNANTHATEGPLGTLHAFDNPVDDTTGSFRETLQSIIADQYKSPSETMDANGIYTAVNRSLNN